MTLIEHQELASAQSSIVFTDIPQTFTDLYLLISGWASGTGASAIIRFNEITTGYSRRNLAGNGSSASSSTASYDFFVSQSDYTTNTFGNSAIYIPNYTSSVAKSYSVDAVNENNATGADQAIVAGLWTVTDPISKIELIINSSYNFVQYSSATLYGLTSGSDGIVSVS
jgi:hypothetical protein